MGAKIEEIFTIEEFLQNKLSEIKWKSLSPSLSLSLSLSLFCVCVCVCVWKLSSLVFHKIPVTKLHVSV